MAGAEMKERTGKLRVEDRPKMSAEDLRTRPRRMLEKYYARLKEAKLERKRLKEER